VDDKPTRSSSKVPLTTIYVSPLKAPSKVRIAGKLAAEQGYFLGPEPGEAGLDARDIVIYVTGINGGTGGLGATPKAAKFGIATTVQANVYVPNGTLWLRQNGQFTGAFLGKWVNLGIGATAEHLSQWSEGSGGSASIGPDAASLAASSSSPPQSPSLGRPVAEGQGQAAASRHIYLASLALSHSRPPAFEGSFAPAFQGQVTSRVIDNSYDPLNRLIEASYSTGELFQYTYNAVGSTMEYSRTITGLSTTTTYAYNAAYQLLTAQEDGGPLWSYSYDGKGQLTEASPDTGPAGARRYGYSTA
jgi:YD repeat-containing protein